MRGIRSAKGALATPNKSYFTVKTARSARHVENAYLSDIDIPIHSKM